MIIVTLTSIPSRIKHLQPVIDSILNQSLPPDRIELYLPKEYKKRSLGAIDTHDLPNGCEIIRCEEDYGPATKILPALQRHKDQNATLIYCDDDRIYDKNWIKRLVSKSERYPNDCITEEGFQFEWYFVKLWQRKKSLLYRARRILSLGLWNPKRKIASNADTSCDIAEGYGGVLVKPHFFAPEVFDIPDILWTVDDTWLSGMMERTGTKIQKTDKNRNEISKPVTSNDNDNPLFAYIYKGFDRSDADCLGIKYFIDKYAIWQDNTKSCFLFYNTIQNKSDL